MSDLLPPFLRAQNDFRAGKPFENPFAAPDKPALDHPHDLYVQGWRVAGWRKDHDNRLKGKK